MKTIGLLGGMSWESTVSYYRYLNEGVKARLGGLHSARIILVSVEFGEIEALMREGRWDEMVDILGLAARRVEAAGADFLLLCTNTIHSVAHRIQAVVNIPLLHIADATAVAIRSNGYRRVGLLGTRFTMEADFFKDRLAQPYGIETIIPEAADRETVHRIIFDELCRGRIEDDSRRAYLRIIEDLGSRGAEAVVLGCTEIALLVSPDQTEIPLLDTTRIHADAALAEALEGRH